MDFRAPFKLPQNRVWRTYLGGKLLDELVDIHEPKDSNFPEDWIASTVPAVNKGREDVYKEGISFIYDNGTKVYFDELLENYSTELLGKEYVEKIGKKINILVKLLDPSIRLHLQVHPTIEFSKKVLNSEYGKAESYIVLKKRDESKESYVYLGFKRTPEKEKLKELILNQEINEIIKYINKVPLNVGDVYFVPGGYPHALGEDVLLIEVQEPTDFVVRFEFERGGYVLPESARFMNLDIDTAMNIFEYKSMPLSELMTNYNCVPKIIKSESGGTEFSLIDERYTNRFLVNKIVVNDVFSENNINSYQICIVSKGNGVVENEYGKFNIKFGDKFFVPFSSKPFRYKSDSELEIVKCLPPKL